MKRSEKLSKERAKRQASKAVGLANPGGQSNYAKRQEARRRGEPVADRSGAPRPWHWPLTRGLELAALVLAVLVLIGATPVHAASANGKSGSITVLNANVSSGTATTGSTLAIETYLAPGSNMYTGSEARSNVLAVQVTGTFTATLTFQASYDMGVTWVSFPVVVAPIPTTNITGAGVTTATSTGKWYANVAGPTHFRVTCTAYTSGTATVVLEKSTGTQLVTIQGMPSSSGGAADGAAVAGNPVLVAGQDGTNAQSLKTDSTGRLEVIGGAADGAAVAGAPVLMAGQDGTNAQTLLTDSTGRSVVVGAAATGAAIAGNPLLMGGSDGTNAQAFRVQANNSTAANGLITLPARYAAALPTLTDGNVAGIQLDVGGRVLVGGSAADDAALAGNPVPVGAKVALSGAQPDAADSGDVGVLLADAERVLYVAPYHPNIINCNPAVSTATTLTAVGGSCAAPGAGLSIYVTDVSFGASGASSTAADAMPTLKYGTGGTCGSGTTVFWSSFQAANVTVKDNLSTPIKIPANNEICWIASEAGSKVVGIRGFIAP